MDNLQFIDSDIYDLKREYGFPIDFYRINSSTVNRETGEKTVTRTVYHINLAVVLSVDTRRKFAYDIAYLAANKNFTYGAMYDQKIRSFLIDSKDLNLVPNNSDYIIYDLKRYDILSVNDYKNCFIIDGKALEGKPLEQILSSIVNQRLYFNEEVENE